MTERIIQYPCSVATRLDEQVFSKLQAFADLNRETNSAALRRIVTSWATFQTSPSRNTSYVTPSENNPSNSHVTQGIQGDDSL